MTPDQRPESEQKPARANKRRLYVLLFLHASLLLYSLTGILSKFASSEEFLSLPFLGYYAGIIALLGIYAIAWQQVIKRIALSTAFANKAITVLWGMFWGVLIFGESMNAWKIIGGILVAIGVIVFVLADKPDETEPPADDELLGEGL